MKNNGKINVILGWLITILVPPIILMLSVRLLISPVFAHIEYRLPGFPEDPYGFTIQDRLRWATPAINYLVNSEDIEFLSSLRFDEGQPVFIERELTHMEDVKDVVSGMRIALIIATVGLLILTLLIVRNDAHKEALKAFERGGWGVIGLIAAILAFVALSFSQLFNWFHQIFFESGTWLFYTSDTLIRLFPMRFWRDAFIFVGALSLLLGVLAIWFSKKECIKRF